MQLRYLIVLIFGMTRALFSSGQGDKEHLNFEGSLEQHLQKIESEIDSLRGTISKSPIIAAFKGEGALPDSTQSQNGSNGVPIGRWIETEIEFLHSEMKFSIENFIGLDRTERSLAERLAATRRLMTENHISIDTTSLLRLSELEVAVEVLLEWNAALDDKRTYFSGAPKELSDRLQKMPPSMRTVGKVARALLFMAPSYRVQACDKMVWLEGEELESLMAFWIYDGQFKERNDQKKTYIDWVDSSYLRSANENLSELYLNEERLKSFTWLNRMVSDIVFGDAEKTDLCKN